nr:hypothetical protein [Micromonospora sp. DSM 115978]
MRARKQLATLADERGIGPLRRVHRSRNALMKPALGWLLLGGGALTTTCYFNISATLGYVVGCAVLATYGYLVFLAPTPEPTGRTWFGVADGGLLVLPEHGTATAAPWTQVSAVAPINDPGEERALRVVLVGDGRPVPVTIREVGGRADLIRAISGRRAAPPPVLRRALIGGVAGAAVLTLAWVALLPDFVTSSESLPGSTGGLVRACERAGARYPDAPAYGGEAPHPIVVFIEHGQGYETADTSADPPVPAFSAASPTEVQLVACARRTGADPLRADSCTYRERFGSEVEIRDMRRAHYTIEVYELRTHERVATVEVEGDDIRCPGEVYGGGDGDLYSRIRSATVRKALDEVVSG